MPRRRQRFKKLFEEYESAGGVGADGSRVGEFAKFLKGQNKIEVKEKLTAAQRVRRGFAILPFGISPPSAPGDGDRYIAPITVYSNTGRIALGLSNNQCGYENITNATQDIPNFYPAVIKCFVEGATAAGDSTAGPVKSTSGILKEGYSRKTGRTYAIPFGRTLTGVDDAVTGAAETALEDVDEQDVRIALVDAAQGTGNNSVRATSVTFLPEEFKTGRKRLSSPV